MVSLKTFLSSSVALIAAFATVEAAVFPSYPFPGSIQNEGQTYDITWSMYLHEEIFVESQSNIV